MLYSRWGTWAMLALFAALLPSCSVVQRSPKYGLKDGYYTAAGNKRVYVHNNSDTIEFYTVGKDRRTVVPPLIPASVMLSVADSSIKVQHFRKRGPDVDFLTIPFKFRPAHTSLPRQFSANLNGAVYLGYRIDDYRISYPASPLSVRMRNVVHYGVSFGLFTGLGSTPMNPWVTQNAITSEYDGVAWNKGVAGIIAVENINAGIAIGWDHLLDHNQRVWIYQGKPWVGLAFGLNLN